MSALSPSPYGPAGEFFLAYWSHPARPSFEHCFQATKRFAAERGIAAPTRYKLRKIIASSLVKGA